MKDRIGQRRRARRRLFSSTRGTRFGKFSYHRPQFEALEARLALASIADGGVDPSPNSNTSTTATDISVTFEQPIFSASVTDQTFVIHGSQSAQYLDPPNTIETSGNVVSFTPGFGVDFSPGELVQTTITSGIQDTGGGPAASYVWQFRARPDGGSGFFLNTSQFGFDTTYGVGLGDLDGDADLDAFLSTSGGRKVWINNGTGNFSSGQILGGSGTPKVLLGDLNGDGHLDAVAGNVYLNNGNGTFTPGQLLEGTALGDVDGDGDLDVLGGSIWLNDGSGTFTPGQTIGKGALGDVDNDGDLDAFILPSGGQGNQVWLNNGSGNFTNTGQSLGSSTSQVVSLGDVNRDGLLDAYVGNSSSQPDRIWLNSVALPGQFIDSGQLLGNTGTRDGQLTDVDGDGDLDVVSTAVNTRVWLNDGNGNFTVTPQNLNGAVGRSLGVGDLDDDGDVDLLVGIEGGGPDRVWLNQQSVPALPDRFEFNNSQATATDLDTSPFHLQNQLLQTHEGLSIHDSVDQDWFKYTVAEEGRVSIRVEFAHAFGDLEVQLFDAGGTQLAKSNSETDNELIEYSDVTAGQILFIKVFGRLGATNPDYDLIVQGSTEPPDIFEGQSGNRSRNSAASLGSNTQRIENLTIHNPGKDDWFRIIAPQNSSIGVSLFFTDDDGDLDLSIEDNFRNEVAFVESDSDNEEVSFPGTAGATFFIHVFGFQGDTSPGYTLQIDNGNSGPVITPIKDQTINEDKSTNLIPFIVSDDITNPSLLNVTGTSSNPALVSNIFFSGGGSNRTVLVVPAPNQSGTAVITVTVKDNTGGTTNESFLLTVKAVADSPILTVLDASGLEDTPIPLTITAALNDIDGSETLTVHISNVPEGSQFSAGTNNGGGNWTFTQAQLIDLTVTPPKDDTSSFTLFVAARATEAESGQIAEDFGSINVEVGEKNDPPVISGLPKLTRIVDEDVSTGPIPFTLSDPETPSNQLTVMALSSDQTLIPDANIVLSGTDAIRTITVTPALNRNGGPVTITVSASDGVNTTVETFTVSVTDINDPPSITEISDQTINEDSATGVIPFTIGDVESGVAPLLVSAMSDNQTLIPDGNIVIDGTGADRTIMVTPKPDQSGSATVSVFVSDGKNISVEPFLVTVIEIGDGPTISSIADQSIEEDIPSGAISFTVGDVDSPLDSLILMATSNDQSLISDENITLGGSGAVRSITLVPSENENGQAIITVTASDGVNSTMTSFVMTVTPVNDAPVVVNPIGPIVTNEDAPNAVFDLTTVFADPDVLTSGDTLIYNDRFNDNPSLVSTSITDDVLTLDYQPNQFGTANVTVRATDNGFPKRFTELIISITVLQGNDLPTIESIDNVVIDEDTSSGPISFVVDDLETPAGALIVTATSSNQTIIPDANLVMEGSDANRTLTITPVPNQTGTVIITVNVNDGTNDTPNPAIFEVTVTPVNDLPTISEIPDQTTEEDVATPEIPFTIGDLETATQSLLVTATSSDQTLVPDANINLGGSGAQRTITLSPAQHRNSNDPVTITVTVDDGSGTVSQTFDVTVTPVNDNPTVSEIVDQSIDEDTSTGPLAFTVNDVESAASLLSVSASSNAQALVPDANIQLDGTGADRTITITPTADMTGTAEITISVQDVDGGIGTRTFLVEVGDVNDDPTISGIGSTSTFEDTTTSAVSFTVDDAETPAASLTLDAGTSDPTLVPIENIVFGGNGMDRTVTITPAPDQNGTVTISITVDDGASGTATTMFVLIVNPVADPPVVVASIGEVVVDEDAPNTVIDLTTVFQDPDVTTNADRLIFSVPAADDGELVNATISGNILTLDYQDDHFGPATILVRAVDTTGLTATDTISLTVRSVNDAPTISNITDQSTDEGTSTNPIAFTVNDVETAANDLAVTASSNNQMLVADGNISVGGSGTVRTVTITPSANQSGSATITLSVADEEGRMTITSFVLSVVETNRPPVITSPDSVSVAENTTAVMTVTATDPDGDVPTYSISGGADQIAFAINSITGALSFGSPKSFDNPEDSNGDNVYEVQVGADDGNGDTTTQLIRVTVTDASAPTVRIVDVSPDPRAGSVNEISIVFTEPITGFGLSDLTLTRSANTTVNLALNSASLTSSDGAVWTLGNLSGLTSGSGIYELRLPSGGSGITDGGGTPLALGDTDKWINGPGDADESGSFDQFDLIVVLQGGKYFTGQPATWREGDFNGDGVFNQSDIIVSLQPNHYLQGSFAATSPAAVDAFMATEMLDMPEEVMPDAVLQALDGDPSDKLVEATVVPQDPMEGSRIDATLAKPEPKHAAESGADEFESLGE